MMADKWMFVSVNLRSGMRTRIPWGRSEEFLYSHRYIGVYTHRYICIFTYIHTCTRAHELPNRRIRRSIFEHALHITSEYRGDEHA